MNNDGEDERDNPRGNEIDPDDDNTIRILLATDTHIGYLERDPVRGQDAINTFREVLQLAVKLNADFILHAGDLFHDNRPSRDVIYQTIALLREYTLGDKPVQVELLSDPDEGKAPGFSFPAVNYEDPNLNVSIPVFSIHGNHDDPQGAGPEGALCALDLLSVTGLLNYMGKIDLPTSSSSPEGEQKEGITIKPVLLRKGNTKLGLYGVGNVKDTRMHFELRSGRVRMYMPRDKEEWFNILLLHQNRVAHGPANSVPEGLFDDSIHLVIWGHEHDCRIIPEAVAGKQYFITQPGSTVATSLTPGEAIEKHAALLLINSTSFSLHPLPLRTVRPFVTDSVILLQASEEDHLDLNDMVAVKRYLVKRVEELIERANKEWEERKQDAAESWRALGHEGDPEEQDGAEPMLPLIRLKVDTTGTQPSFNTVRFGMEFTDRVANPRDVLVFHRAPRRNATNGAATAEPELEELDDPSIPISEKIARVRVSNLVREYLAAQQLQVLGEGGLSDAIQSFVEKEDSHSIQTFVDSSLKSVLKDVTVQIKEKTIVEGAEEGDGEESGDEDFEERIRLAKESHQRAYEERNHIGDGSGNQNERENDAASVDSMEMDLDADLVDDLDRIGTIGDRAVNMSDDEDEVPVRPKTTRGKKTTATKKTTAKTTAKPSTRGKSKATTSGTTRGGKSKAKPRAVASASEDDFDADHISSGDEDDAPPPPKKTGRAAILSTIPTRKPSQTPKRAQATLSFVPSQSTRPTGGRRAAVTARAKASAQVLDSDDDDDE